MKSNRALKMGRGIAIVGIQEHAVGQAVDALGVPAVDEWLASGKKWTEPSCGQARASETTTFS